MTNFSSTHQENYLNKQRKDYHLSIILGKLCNSNIKFLKHLSVVVSKSGLFTNALFLLDKSSIKDLKMSILSFIFYF